VVGTEGDCNGKLVIAGYKGGQTLGPMSLGIARRNPNLQPLKSQVKDRHVQNKM
jgi:hypothetical protein